MKKIRFGLVGCGVMGKAHISYIRQFSQDAELVGLCDVNRELAESLAAELGAKAYSDYKELINKNNIDAVIIATPHYYHPDIAIWAFENDVHVLCEKPIAVHVKDANRMIEAYKRHSHLKFGVVYSRRTAPLWRELKELIDRGELGRIYRIDWTITDWFRTECYYSSGGWRGSWSGEGGGVTVNQCPHQFDLFYWLFGLPDRLIAIGGFGKYHRNITVDDEIIAMGEWNDGKVFTLKVSTSEYPGSNRLEIASDRGILEVSEKVADVINFRRTMDSVEYVIRNSTTWTSGTKVWEVKIPIIRRNDYEGTQCDIVRNFIDCLLGRESDLIAPGVEGLGSVMLGNALVLAGFYKRWVELPIDADEYLAFLNERIEEEKKKKNL